MATYVNDLRLKEIATGDESGTWGTSTNTNLELIAEAFSFGTEAITSNADTHTTTIADGSTDPGRSIYLKYTGALDSDCTITIGPNTVSKLWFIENATTDSGSSGPYNIIISQGSGANITIPNSHVKAIYSDGAGSGAAMVDAFTDLNLAGTTTVDDLTVSDDLTVTDDATIGGTLGVTGAVTANAGVSIDNITIDGTEIDLSSGDLSIDVAGNIQLDADDNGEIRILDGGTQFAQIKKDGNNALFQSIVADGDFIIQGIDGSSFVSALTLDMSDAGSAYFNSKVGIGTTSPSNNLHIFTDAGDEGITIKSTGNTSNAIIMDANRSSAGNSIGEIQSKWNGTAVTMVASLTGSDTTNKDNGQLKFYTAANGTAGLVERMVIDDEGAVGIGTSAPVSVLHLKNSASDGVAGISLENDARRYAINVHGGLSDGLAVFNAGAGETQLFIASAGNVGIGADNTSPDSVLSVKDATSDPIVTVHKNSTGVSDALRVQHGRGLSGFTGKGISFRRNDGTEVGSVVIGFSSTSFNTSSDYRLKENVTYSWDATTRLKQLKPARFNFKDDTSDLVDGFLAHEVSSIVPEAINGEKDAVDSEGNPEYQSIDQSKLVPLLVKTIQELEARITALES